MGRRFVGWVVAALGAAIVVLSVLADAFGIGGQDYVFGWLQMTGVVVGSAVVTIWLVRGRGLRGRLVRVQRRRLHTA